MLKGNAIVGQSGGPTSAINATLAGVIRGAAEAGASTIPTLFGMRNGIEGVIRGEYVNLTELVCGEEALYDLSHTPAAALGSCRKKLPHDATDPLYDTLRKVGYPLLLLYRRERFYGYGGEAQPRCR